MSVAVAEPPPEVAPQEWTDYGEPAPVAFHTEISASRKQIEVIHAAQPEVICDGRPQSGKSFAIAHKFVKDAVSRKWPDIRDGTFNGFSVLAKTAEQARNTGMRNIGAAAREYGLEYISHRAGPDYMIINDNRIPITPHGIGSSGSESNLLGRTYGLMMFEEIAECDRVAHEYAITRSSMPGARISYACNPRHSRHWVKRELIDSEDPNIGHWAFDFLDNPILEQGYIDRLRRTLSPTQFKRLFLGIWADPDNAVWHSEDLDAASIPWTDFPDAYDIIIVSVDPAWSTHEQADHTGIVVLGQKGGEIYHLHAEKLKVTSETMADHLYRIYTDFQASLLLYESNGRGKTIPDLIAASGYPIKSEGRPSVTDKRARAEAVKPAWANYYVWLPMNAPPPPPPGMRRDRILPTSRLEVLRDQLLDFTGEGDEDDDVLDADTMGVRFLIDRAAKSTLFVSAPVDIDW